jgi:carboxyl-terminal processing protease
MKEADKQKIKPKDDEERDRTLPLLRMQLKALIARDLWDMSEYYSIFNEDSEIVAKALELLQ